eukprot:12115310-Ditylum_brightwellii.AAC.1
MEAAAVVAIKLVSNAAAATVVKEYSAVMDGGRRMEVRSVNDGVVDDKDGMAGILESFSI